jgi:hypothetical protein
MNDDTTDVSNFMENYTTSSVTICLKYKKDQHTTHISSRILFGSVRFGFTKVRTDPITAMLYKLSIFYEPFLKSLLLNRLMQSIQTKECLRMMME